MNMINIFWVITVEFPPMTDIDLKCFPNSAFCGYFFFIRCKAVFQSFLIFIFYHYFNTVPDNFQIQLPSLIAVFKLSFFHYFSQNFPNIDVVTIDTLLNVGNKLWILRHTISLTKNSIKGRSPKLFFNQHHTNS